MIPIDDRPSNILIIGNGFDLNLGLKTGYSDFISSTQFQSLLSSDNHLAIHLKNKHNLYNWVDIEKELKKYSKEETKSHSVNSKFELNFESLSFALKEYLKTIDYSNIDKKSVAYSLLKKIAARDFVILDFNYTDSTKMLLKSFMVSNDIIKSRLLKIHGSIEEDEIIFGVEDNADIKHHHVFLHKAFPQHFKGYKFGLTLRNVVQLHIFGHSLGETDHTYFKDFFNAYSENTNIIGKEIYLYHYGKNGYRELHQQIYSLINGRLSAFKEINHFITRDVMTLNPKLI